MDAELTRLMSVLDQASGRLGDSYSRIAALQAEVAAKDRALAHRSRLEMLGRMAATLAHEIRNPLGGIQLYAAMLRRDGADRETCDRILAAVADLNRLVEDMLTYGRDAEPIKLPLDLGTIADEAIALAGIEGRVRVVRRYTAGQVLADGDMMRRAFLNLVINAGQVMDGGTLVVETSPSRAVFRDSGPGLPADVLARLFTPFMTTRAQGTGLGLAIARKIIEAHGGTITAANVKPHGAEFVISLAANSFACAERADAGGEAT
jgi:signal transduction histidine kinase